MPQVTSTIDSFLTETTTAAEKDAIRGGIEAGRVPDQARWAVGQDWHMFQGGPTGGNQRTRDAMNDVRGFNPAFLVINGDLSEPIANADVSAEEINRMVGLAGCPVYLGFGNHERTQNAITVDSGEDQVSLDNFYNVVEDYFYRDSDHYNGTDTKTGYYYFYHRPSNTHQIILNGVETFVGDADPVWANQVGGWAWTATQKAWLQGVLDSITGADSRIVLYSHTCLKTCPVGTQPAFNRWRQAEEDELHSMLTAWKAANGKVLGVFAGHIHRSSRTATVDGINYIEIQNARGGSAVRGALYEAAASTDLSWSECYIDEANSKFEIIGHGGVPNYSLDI